MAGQDVIAQVKDAELKAAAIVADAERQAEAIKAAAKSEAADILKNSTAESRRNFESSLLLERERAKQQKEELLKIGRKEIYAEEERAKSRIPAALEELVRRLEEYFNAETC